MTAIYLFYEYNGQTIKGTENIPAGMTGRQTGTSSVPLCHTWLTWAHRAQWGHREARCPEVRHGHARSAWSQASCAACSTWGGHRSQRRSQDRWTVPRTPRWSAWPCAPFPVVFRGGEPSPSPILWAETARGLTDGRIRGACAWNGRLVELEPQDLGGDINRV
jgi:hypothetical protein